MATSERPKTKQMTIDKADLHSGAFANETLFGRSVTYKTRGYRARWNYRDDGDRTIHTNDDVIKGEYSAYLSEKELKEFFDWMTQNVTWHVTKVSPYTGGSAEVRGSTFDLPVFKPSQIHVSSTFYRKMTDVQKEDLEKVKAAKADRMAKQKEATKLAAAKRREAEKKAREAEKKAQERAAAKVANSEFTDLAQALKVLKKHGLKIVTVEEKTK
jgi:hypothetical protein